MSRAPRPRGAATREKPEAPQRAAFSVQDRLNTPPNRECGIFLLKDPGANFLRSVSHATLDRESKIDDSDLSSLNFNPHRRVF